MCLLTACKGSAAKLMHHTFDPSPCPACPKAEALAARKEAEVKLKEAQAALAQANNRLAALMKQAKA